MGWPHFMSRPPPWRAPCNLPLMSLFHAVIVPLSGLLAAVGMVGCAQPHFTGLTPTTRTFNETAASTRDYYVGLNANFSVGQPEGPQGAAGAAAAQAKSATQPALMPPSTPPQPRP